MAKRLTYSVVHCLVFALIASIGATPTVGADLRPVTGSEIAGDLKGCWTALPTADFLRRQAKDPTIWESFKICFEDSYQGKMVAYSGGGGGTYVGDDGVTYVMLGDGWDDVYSFELVGRKLVFGGDNQKEFGCDAELPSAVRLELINCEHAFEGQYEKSAP